MIGGGDCLRLFDRAREGDLAARDELLAIGYGAIVVAVGVELGRGHPDAGDVAGATWLRFHDRWQRWGQKAPFECYAAGFVRFGLRDHFRCCQRIWALEQALQARGPAPRPPWPAFEPMIDARRTCARLWFEIARLPARQREIVQRTLAGQAQSEIAARMDITRGAVANQLYTARQTLQDSLRGGGWD